MCLALIGNSFLKKCCGGGIQVWKAAVQVHYIIEVKKPKNVAVVHCYVSLLCGSGEIFSNDDLQMMVAVLHNTS